MTNKLLLASFLTALVIFSGAGLASAAEEAKPWENLFQFRGGMTNSAQELNWDKEDFWAWRNQAREEHQALRLAWRADRLQSAVAKGCLDEAGLKERLAQRLNRFRQ